MKLLAVQRRDAIKTYLVENESITVQDIIKMYDVSVETVRRDLDVLASEGFLNKVYGGAVLKKRTSAMPRELIDHAFSEGKERVAARAARFMKPGDTIFLDQTNAVSRMCKCLMDMEITVLTNSLNVLNELSPSKAIKLIAVGGRFDPNEQAFMGPTATAFLQRFQVDRAFLSCKSFDMKKGVCVADERDADMKQTIIECAEHPYLLVDHSIFGRASFARFCGMEDIECIFTDKAVDEMWRSYFERKSVKVFECTGEPEREEGWPSEDGQA